jgi:two-component sensor histidine kinase
MAAVHDFMTGSDVVSASLYDLAYKIGDATLSTLLKPAQQIKLVVDREKTESIRIDSHKATLLALLINELVSNAVLHGFEDVNRGEIRIRAWEEEAPETIAGRAGARMPPVVHIEVADTGLGLPEGFDLAHDANLGLNIVRTMVVSDLRGDFSISPRLKGRGTVAQLWFPNTHVSVAP